MFVQSVATRYRYQPLERQGSYQGAVGGAHRGNSEKAASTGFTVKERLCDAVAPFIIIGERSEPSTSGGGGSPAREATVG